VPGKPFVFPYIVIVGFGSIQTYQIVCFKCGNTFFPDKHKKEGYFCDDCRWLPDHILEKYIPAECYSENSCIGKIVRWESRTHSGVRRGGYRNYNRAYKRDNYTCQYCGYNTESEDEFVSLSIDHIKPLSYGGNYRLENLVVSCLKCNMIANDRIFDNFERKRRYILQRRLDKNLHVNKHLVAFYDLKLKEEELYTCK